MLQAALIGLGLAMDAFAVSVSSGISIPGLKRRYALRAALFFGVFQFVMPVAGWFLGSAFVAYIAAVDHWIAFGLLAFIGGKTLVEALSPVASPKASPASPEKEAADAVHPAKLPADIRNLKTLFVLALATSIDALAVGISFSITGERIGEAAGIIGGVTFLVCLAGFEFGKRAGAVFKCVNRKSSQIAGGLILIGIGVKILLEHLLSR
jgi:putative Mn2+ efflux pump MntP